MTDVDPRWYDGFFENGWLDYAQPEHDLTLRQVDFVVEELALTPGNSVLDVACGRGRHSVELARRGLHVTGVDNERVVQRVASALRPGGCFLIDTINPVALARVFRERDWHEFDDGSLLLEQRTYDHLSGRIRGTWTFIGPDGSRTVQEHLLRAYVPAELLTFLRRADLEVARAWGSFDRTELGDGTRTILLAHKA